MNERNTLILMRIVLGQWMNEWSVCIVMMIIMALSIDRGPNQPTVCRFQNEKQKKLQPKRNETIVLYA